MARKQSESSPIEPREFRSPEEIDFGIAKLRRRIKEMETVDIRRALLGDSAEGEVAIRNTRETIREIFGANSPEFMDHKNMHLGPMVLSSSTTDDDILMEGLGNQRRILGYLNGLIGRLEEKKEDLVGGTVAPPSTYFDRLNLHPRIRDVARDLFLDGHPWDAVFAASKALLNYVKERSNRHDLDGAPLVRAVFSRNDPILAFNDLADTTQLDEQEGMMHLFEGAVLAIRNPGGHAFPEGPEQRAIEYISFLSLLAYRVQEAELRKKTL